MNEEAGLRGQVDALRDRVAQVERELEQLRRSSQPALTYATDSGAAPTARQPEPQEDMLPKNAAGFAVVAARSAQPRASLESRIGSQLFNRIGILALLIGAAWFLKFAIDERWIGPAARVWIGLGAGLGLVGWSEWFRTRGYTAFSYSLKALGTGVLYLSVWAAYTLFGLVPASVAFAAMMLITVTNAWLCWRQNSELLAFYALAGGLLTPLLLWAAEGAELTLFSYLLMLDLAVLVLVAQRPWSRLVLAAFAGTAVYEVAWYVGHYTPESLAMTTCFVATFFLLFSAAPQLLRNFRLASGVGALTFEDQLALLLLPLLNGLLAFAEFYALLSEPQPSKLRAWVAFGLAFFYLGLLRVARSPRLRGTPTRLPDTYLLLSVLAFTGAVPLAVSGRAIALGWLLESLVLVWIARAGVALLRGLGTSALALGMLACLTLNSRLPGNASVLLNARFATFAAGVVAGVTVAWIAGRVLREAGGVSEMAPGWRSIYLLGSTGATALLMVGMCLEIGTYWNGQLSLSRLDRVVDEQFTYSAWTMLLGAGLLGAGFATKAAVLRWQGLVLLALSIGKVFLFDLRELSQGYRIVSFLGLGVLLVCVSFVYQRDLLKLRAR